MADHRSHGRATVHLTRRQTQILLLAADGLGAAEISRHLGISPRTVEGHVSAARTRAGARNVTELVARCYATGIFNTRLGPPLPEPGALPRRPAGDPAGTGSSPVPGPETAEQRPSGGVQKTRGYETPGTVSQSSRTMRPQPDLEHGPASPATEMVNETPAGVAAVHPNLVGLARVSTSVQDAQVQRDALTAAGCGRIFEETISTRTTERPGRAAALDYLRPADTLCVWKLDRLGRSVKDVLIIADDLHERGIGLRILTGQLAGTYTPTGEGKFFFTMMAAFAELERDIIHERTMAGLAAARIQGRTGGRPTVMDADKLAAAQARLDRGESPTQIAKDLGVSRATIYRHLARHHEPNSQAAST